MYYRAIIFDDNEEVLALLTHIFKTRGYDVYAYKDPAVSPLIATDVCDCECREACSDFLVSDLEMPSMKGTEFIRLQKGRGCKIEHIALISGNWRNGDREEARKYTDALFSKPLDIPDFIEWVERCEATIPKHRKLSAFEPAAVA